MQHFSYLDHATRDHLFLKAPEQISSADEIDTIAAALGATLYIPAIRDDLAAVVARRVAEGVCSLVLDLEDAIADHQLEQAVSNTVAALIDLSTATDFNALVFVRVRSVEDLQRISAAIDGHAGALAGFVIPKFTAETGSRFLGAVSEASARHGKQLYVMPVLESPEVVFRETRDQELIAIKELLTKYSDSVLAVRIGATDMCGTFGIRRDRDLTIYDVRVVADAISAIVNYLARFDGRGFVITGPVWEYFADHERIFRPMLRATPFEEHKAVRFRQHLVSSDLDALLREVTLDRANGILGKTVIHPSHVAAVHSLCVVTHEEYHDALDILETADVGGVHASGYHNKMNEAGPHRNWAQQTVRRAHAFGVANEGITFVDILTGITER